MSPATASHLGRVCAVLASLLALHSFAQAQSRPPGGDAKNELAARALDTSKWQCSSRPTQDNDTQTCVITGLASGVAHGAASNATPNGGNLTATCDWKVPVFCDDSIGQIVASYIQHGDAPLVDDPPVGYTLFPGVGYYKVHAEQQTWQQGRRACAAEGAQLAVPSTPADYAAILVMINAALPERTQGAFVGLTDARVEGSFVSVIGQPLCALPLAVFAAGEPDNGRASRNEDCLALGEPGHGAAMDDVDCSKPRPFVCERQLAALVVSC